MKWEKMVDFYLLKGEELDKKSIIQNRVLQEKLI